MAKQIYVNLPIKNLKKTREFFTKLGFSFYPDFTDKNALCMIIGKNIYAMLLVEKFFKTFTKKEIANAKKSTEVMNAISVESRKKVDELVKKAMASGGKVHRDAEDHGWMYGQSIEDIDGHIWEFFYMDESKREKQ